MSHSYVRIPPDSTGKLILSEERRIVTYDNNTGGTFEVGQTVTGTGGATGVITGIRTKGFPANEGRLYLEQNSGTWSDNEAIQVNAVTFANVNTSGANGDNVDDVHIQSNVISDSDRPSDTYLYHLDLHRRTPKEKVSYALLIRAYLRHSYTS